VDWLLQRRRRSTGESSRHLNERSGFPNESQVATILDSSGLELVSGQVRAKGSGVNEDTAYRYKQAIKDVLGAAA
jgi:hypothetical protein